jgi:cytochrome c biogenesis protein CcdA
MNAAIVFSIALYLAGMAVLYLVIRLAVKHAIEDADHRRRMTTYPPD